jgi:hypothetical protein
MRSRRNARPVAPTRLKPTPRATRRLHTFGRCASFKDHRLSPDSQLVHPSAAGINRYKSVRKYNFVSHRGAGVVRVRDGHDGVAPARVPPQERMLVLRLKRCVAHDGVLFPHRLNPVSAPHPSRLSSRLTSQKPTAWVRQLSYHALERLLVAAQVGLPPRRDRHLHPPACVAEGGLCELSENQSWS